MALSRLARLERAALVGGAAIRVVAILVVQPDIYSTWFVPFIRFALALDQADPWSAFVNEGGDAAAFPYGPLYLVIFAPLVAIGASVAGQAGAATGLMTTVALLDVALFLTLRRLAARDVRAVITFTYWLSPIVLYVCYWHGQLDVLPVLILTLALLALKRERFRAAGFALGSAVAAKLSMAVAVPFIWVYVTSARRFRPIAPRLIAATLVGMAVLVPFLVSPGFRAMVLGTSEAEKAFALAVFYGQGASLYVLPVVFGVLIYAAWRIRRFNFDILLSLTGAGFFALFLLTPASPGWAMWLAPFIALRLTRSNAGAWVLAWAFAGLFVVFNLTVSPGAVAGTIDLRAPLQIDDIAGPHATNLLFSIYLAAGALFAINMFRNSVVLDPFYRSTRNPLVIGIAGDSGAGKDTLAEAVSALFGSNSTARLSGDDYHVWDRQKPMWRALTHLNPTANNLRRFNEDVKMLAKGASVRAPHYDHHTGRMTKPRRLRSRDVVIASGLHALYTPELLRVYDIRIFLQMDESLRHQLKIERDVAVRGHTAQAVMATLQAREADSERYIRPQVFAADLILALEPLEPVAGALVSARDRPLALRIESSQGNLTDLVRGMIGLVGLRVSPETSVRGFQAIRVDGAPTSDDIAALAQQVSPAMLDYLALQPGWRSGLLGLMQVAVIEQLGQLLAARRA